MEQGSQSSPARDTALSRNLPYSRVGHLRVAANFRRKKTLSR